MEKLEIAWSGSAVSNGNVPVKLDNKWIITSLDSLRSLPVSYTGRFRVLPLNRFQINHDQKASRQETPFLLSSPFDLNATYGFIHDSVYGTKQSPV